MNEIDALIGNADAFPIPHAAGEAMRTFTREAEVGAYLNTAWYKDIDVLRTSAAALINAHRDEIAFVSNTSHGLAQVAAGIDFHPGDRIVTTNVEYPANIYPWMDLSRRLGVELVMVEEETDADGRRHVPLDKLLAAADRPKTRLVSLSHVEFASGQRHDLAATGRFCRQRGILFCVDAIQSLGVLPIDVAAMNIDYLSADGHKWLLGPEGAGVFYCRRELLARTRPLIVGWMNVKDAENFGNYDFTLKDDARRYEAGSFNVAGLLGLKASLEMLLSLGTETVARRLESLTDRLIGGLIEKGYHVLSPRKAAGAASAAVSDPSSGIVSFASPTHDHAEITRTLRRDQRIEIALRVNRLRVSPHFYNTENQIDRLLDTLPRH